jgi:hypothetical protein
MDSMKRVSLTEMRVWAHDQSKWANPPVVNKEAHIGRRCRSRTTYQ